MLSSWQFLEQSCSLRPGYLYCSESFRFRCQCFASGSGFFGFGHHSLLVGVNPLENRILTERLTEFVVIVALMGAGLKLDRPVSWRGWESSWRLLGIAIPLTIAGITILGWSILGLGIAIPISECAVKWGSKRKMDRALKFLRKGDTPVITKIDSPQCAALHRQGHHSRTAASRNRPRRASMRWRLAFVRAQCS